jgi:hemolysin activation/secretion protein
MRSKRSLIIVLFVLFLISTFYLPTSSLAQTASQYEKSERELEKEEELRERIEKKEEKPIIKEEEEEVVPEEEGRKVFVKKIEVTGVTVFPKEKIREIVKDYEGKELSVREIHKVADLITDLYRQKEYLTSRAYIPPQDLTGGILEIRVLEGKMGDLKIENPGKVYFSDKLIKSKVRIKKGEYFDYERLRKSLIKINEHPDRTAKAVLAPGTEPGQTDVVLIIDDQRTYHAGFEYDNFGSRYIGKDRYTLTFDHNNLTGHDDILSLKYLMSDGDHYDLESLRYLLPLGYTWEMGLYAVHSELELAEEFEATEAEGKSTIASVFANKYLVDEENLEIKLTSGFDYKHIRNFQLGIETSRDEMRIAKLGLDVDKTDRWGRTLLINEFSYGIPDLWGSLDAVDDEASRDGAGGKFTKWNITLIRLQSLPFPNNATLLWENQFQVSPYILTSSEEFQIGGIRNNRGYPPAEKTGDEGLSSTVELSTPVSFMSKDWTVPFSQTKVYDALRFVAFYDWGHTEVHRPAAGEGKKETLSSAGCGLRFNMPEQDLSVRVEFGWPLMETPSDGDHMHSWVKVSKSF